MTKTKVPTGEGNLYIEKGCPSCGADIVIETKEMGVLHPLPICKWYERTEVLDMMVQIRQKLEATIQ